MPHGIEGKAKTRTICEVHRELYRMLKNDLVIDRDDAIDKLKEAYDMAKRMSKRLLYYKRLTCPGWKGDLMDELNQGIDN